MILHVSRAAEAIPREYFSGFTKIEIKYPSPSPRSIGSRSKTPLGLSA